MWLTCNLLGSGRLMQNRTTNWNTVPAEKPLPCHMAKKTPRFFYQQVCICQLSVLPMWRKSPTQGSAWCKALLILHQVLTGRENLQCRLSDPPSLPSSYLSLRARVFSLQIQPTKKHETRLFDRGIFHLLRAANSTILLRHLAQLGASLLSDPW